MAQVSYEIPELPKIEGAKTAIIYSEWHRECSESMIAKMIPILEEAQAETPAVHMLPGCLEIPLAAKKIVQNNPDLEAIIVFGVILKGDTYHFDMILNSCTEMLNRVSYDFDIPVINEILPVTDFEHVKSRTSDNDKNKGIEAGIATVKTIDWRRRNS